MLGSLVDQLLEIESACYQKVVAYNVTAKLLTITREGKSCQFAESYVVYQALKQENLTECHIYTDSWLVANGLATQLPLRVKINWQIHSRESWGKERWSDIWGIVQTTNVSVFRVDVLSVPNSME